MIDYKRVTSDEAYGEGVKDAYLEGFNMGGAVFRRLCDLRFEWVKPNPKKHATAVKFRNGDIVIVKLSKGEKEGDIYQAVAYAVAEEVYLSNSAFKKAVDKALKAPKKGPMQVIKNRLSEEQEKAMKEACDRIAEEARKGK